MTNIRYVGFTVFTVIFIILLSFAVYSFNKKSSIASLQKKLNQTLGNETTDLVEKVDKIIRLPTDETPVIDTVNDVNQYQSQVFFRNAKNGDKVLVYKETRRAFLYRPSENKIIEVGWVKLEISPTPQLTNNEYQISASPSALPTSRV